MTKKPERKKIAVKKPVRRKKKAAPENKTFKAEVKQKVITITEDKPEVKNKPITKGKDQMNLRQKKFCHEYLVDFNGTNAAIRAGYSKKSANQIAVENLMKPTIRAYIDKVTRIQFMNADLKTEDILRELKSLAFTDIKDYLSYDEAGNITFKHSDEVNGRGISEITRTEGKEGVNFKFKLIDKLKPLEILAKYVGLLIEKTEEKKEWTVIIKDYDGKEDELRRQLKQGVLNQLPNGSN
jgi:phage terminase small subunit